MEGRGEDGGLETQILHTEIKENLDEAGRTVNAQLSKREASGWTLPVLEALYLLRRMYNKYHCKIV